MPDYEMMTNTILPAANQPEEQFLVLPQKVQLDASKVLNNRYNETSE